MRAIRFAAPWLSSTRQALSTSDLKTTSQLLDEIQELRERVQHLERSAEARERAEKMLRRSERDCRAWLENSPVCTKIVDLEFNLRFMSDSGWQSLHIDNKDEYYGKPYPFEFYPGPFREQMTSNLERVKSTGEVVTQEAAVTDLEGSEVWFHSTLVPVDDDDGYLDYIIIVSIDTTERRKAEATIRNEKELLRRLIVIQDDERRMVAHDIHDGFLQDVVGAHLRVQAISDRISGQDGVGPTTQEIDTLLEKAIAEGRRLIRDLRPIVLDDNGVVVAVSHLIADLMQHGKQTIAFQHEVQFDRLDPKLEGAIFRIIQEALNNFSQHSQAAHAGVQLKQIGDSLQIAVRDLGVGFDQKQVAPDRFGLRGIVARADLFGGTAAIDSAPGEGTSIKVQLPLDFETATIGA